MAQLPLVCISEDRVAVEPAVRILIASLKRATPEITIHLFMPAASVHFVAWAERYKGVQLEQGRAPGEYSQYDVKPHALLALLDRGHDDILWIDSDIVVTAALKPLLAGSQPGMLMVTEEMLGEFHADDDACRARGWGFSVGREFPFALNTGVMRVGPQHRDLLLSWRALLKTDGYLAAQRKLWKDRPKHLLGDQDVLTALLSSSHFAHVPVRLLKRGRDILQFSGPYGYTLSERMGHLVTGLPPFIHSLGHKPWAVNAKFNSAYGRFNDLYLGVSPYTLMAARYSGELERTDWLRAPNAASATFRALALGVIPLAGLPLAVAADLVRLGKSLRKAMSSKASATQDRANT